MTIEEDLINRKNVLDVDNDFNLIENLYYHNEDLGAIYIKKKTIFKLWSPTAEKVSLVLFSSDDKNAKKKYLDMKKCLEGVWCIELKGDYHGQYYNYRIEKNNEIFEVTDPYCKAINITGDKSMVINLEKTNPKRWKNKFSPKMSRNPIIYELSIRDFTIDEASGVREQYRGKYKGLTFLDNEAEIKTGLSHLVELGVTHVQLMPIYDFSSSDKNVLNGEYNWGYNPRNYNVPEGIYSTNPNDAVLRIRELKEMIMKLHDNGIRVIMDVVYNHIADSINSNFNKIVPKYYYRFNENGEYSNGSGCGNEIATERRMVRKFIIDSIIYWTKEYKIDGFRLDLMGLYDIETVEEIRKELDKIDKDILLLGEGWKGGESTLSNENSMIKDNIRKIENKRIACFNDNLRDAIKGNVFSDSDRGFVSGKANLEETIKFGIVGAIEHRDIDYSKVIYNKHPWANESFQSINYDSCHDNYTLWDKLSLANKDASKEDLIDMNKLSAAIVLTSQGIPFINSGEELLRTKKKENGEYDGNSYRSSDSVNKIYWNTKKENKDIFDYYRELISLRKNHNVFNIGSKEKINKYLKFIDENKFSEIGNLVAYTIECDDIDKYWSKVLVAFNGSNMDKYIELDDKGWEVILDKDKVRESGIEYIEGSRVRIKRFGAFIAVKFKNRI